MSLKGYGMINDTRKYTEHNRVLSIDGVVTEGDYTQMAKDYMKQFDIAPVGCSIVYHNAIQGGPAPSGQGTMYNLYILFICHKGVNNG